MEGVADPSSAPLSGFNWDVYKDAFAPPPPRQQAKAWDRAPVAAHAPRLQGQKIWKKVNMRFRDDKENDPAVQEELLKAGTGSRKKPRLRGAKENIGDAQWLDPLQPRAYGDDVIAIKVPMPASHKNALQVVPRKRTHADRFISPQKSLRKSPFRGQKTNISPMAPVRPIAENHPQRRKSIRKSIRRSMLDQSEIEAAEFQNKEEDAESFNSVLLLGEQQFPLDKERSSLGELASDQLYPPFPMGQPTNGSPKSEELNIHENDALDIAREISLTPKKPRRRISQRVRARRGSKITHTSLNASEGSTAQEAIPVETWPQPDQQKDATVETQTTTPFANPAPLPHATSSNGTERAQSPRSLKIPIPNAVYCSNDQEKGDTFSAFEPETRDVGVSIPQDTENLRGGQVELSRTDQPVEIEIDLDAQDLEETTVHAGSVLTIAHCPGAQLCDSPRPNPTPDLAVSPQPSYNETTTQTLAALEPNSAPLSLGRPASEAMDEDVDEAEQDVAGTITPGSTNNIAGSSAGNTLFSSYDHDDTDMLRSFLTRVKANKAANAIQNTQKRRRSLPHSPLRLPLGDLDGLIGSPSSPKANDEFDVSLPTASPSKRTKHDTTANDTEDIMGAKPVRRSGRTKLPVKTPLPAPCFIPVRRLGQDGDNTVTLRRSEEKELAALTRVNTRKNKGGAVCPADVLARKMEEKDDPASRQRALKEMFDDKMQKQKQEKRGKCVAWAEKLAQYQNANDSKFKEANNGKGNKKTVPSQGQSSVPRRCIGSKIALGMAANGTPAPKRKVRGRS